MVDAFAINIMVISFDINSGNFKLTFSAFKIGKFKYKKSKYYYNKIKTKAFIDSVSTPMLQFSKCGNFSQNRAYNVAWKNRNLNNQQQATYCKFKEHLI